MCTTYYAPGVETLPPGLWYASAFEASIPEIMNNYRLGNLKKDMQRGHAPLDNKASRVKVLRQYCAAEPHANPIKATLSAALKSKAGVQKIKATLNEPTFEAFKILKLAGLPKKGDVVFSSTATANSGNNDAMTTALDIMACTEGVELHRSSTVNSTGRTGVSNVEPRNKAVQFDEHCKVGTWKVMVRALGIQFLQITDEYMRASHAAYAPPNRIGEALGECSNDTMPHMKLNPVYDRMYHWGCISQPWITNLLGHHVSQWAVHEEWNVNMTIAMMWHAAMTAKAGGQVCLKIRIFRRAETLGLTALFSNLFDKCVLTENSRQTCYFAVGVFDNMTADEGLRLNVASALWRAMDQKPEHIFQHPLMFTQRSRDMLPICTDVRRVIDTSLAKANSAFLICFRCFAECKKTPESIEQFKNTLRGLFSLIYTREAAEYFLKEWEECVWKTNKEDMVFFRRLMSRPWMKAVC
jgi:hypothetical protein